MPNIKVTHNGNYSEEGQVNPLRWCILKQVGPDDFISQSNWLKCKDFFNDYVYSYHSKKDFTIYGFNAGKMDIPYGGNVFMALKHQTPAFVHNITKAVNPWLVEQGMPELILTPANDGMLLLELDKKYFDNTLNISLISLLIRVVNTLGKFKNFEEIKNFNGIPDGDKNKWGQVVAKGTYFNIPEKYRKYLWYYDEKRNSEKVTDPKDYQLSHLVHNCGVLAWQQAIK